MHTQELKCAVVPPPVDLLSTVASGANDLYPATDLDILDRALVSVSDMLDRVLTYVRSVLSGEVKGDRAVGRYLMDTFDASTEELEKGAFNTSLQVSTCLLAFTIPLSHVGRKYRTHSWSHTSRTWSAHRQKSRHVWL